MDSVLINPPASALSASNAVLWGRGRAQYHVREFSGPLSIKSMVRGVGEWRAGRARFDIDPDSYLVLNHGQPYTLTIDSPSPVETLCVFFRRGYVEDALRSLGATEGGLLDDPSGDTLPLFEVPEARRPADRVVSPLLARVRSALAAGEPLEPVFGALALALARDHCDYARAMTRLQAVKHGTRMELHRRVQIGRRVLDDCLDQPLQLASVARASCLSPFHFHRAFRAVFGETPHGYLTRRRLERAARLLRETDEPVTRICLGPGFQSPGSFSSLFRERFGVSPRNFRKNKQDSRSGGRGFGAE